jgi:hypothetical protein
MRVIIAPSATGKTTFSRDHAATTVDGDQVVKETIGWPAGKWWLTEKKNKTIADAIAAIRRWAPKDKIVLFADWTAPKSNERVVVVVPEPALLRRHVASRMQHQPKRAQPDVDEVLKSLVAYAEFASAHGLRTFATIDEAYNHLREEARV